MMKTIGLRLQEKTRGLDASYWCLLAIAFVDFLIIILGPYMDFYLDELLLIPCALFVSIILKREKTATAKKVLLLGAIMCAWFMIAQFLHHHWELQTRPVGMFFSVYLMALPFAALAGDERKGLKLYMSVFLSAMLVILFFTALLMMKKVPSFWKTNIHFWKQGLIVMIHPSQLAGFLLAGIGFTLAMMSMTKRLAFKVALLIFLVLMSVILAMTRGFAAIWMMCLFFGVYCFLAISKGSAIRFVAGIAVAVIAFGCSYIASQDIVKWYDYKSGLKKRSELIQTDRIIHGREQHEIVLASRRSEQTDADNKEIHTSQSWRGLVRTAKAENDEEEVATQRFSLRDTLERWLPSLNGRKRVWLDIYDILKKDPRTLIYGTDYLYHYSLNEIGKGHNHSHNSWLDVIVALGIPGFLIVALITAIAFWHVFLILFGKQYELWQKCIALLVACLMAVGAMEPHLFLGGHYLAERNSLHPSDFTFFLCLGYMIQWRAADKASRNKLKETASQDNAQESASHPGTATGN